MEKIQDQERLATLIHQWNQDHYDIFELSRPNENLEFHGVVRFYFQDGANVVTKCIRVASTASTKEVVDVLIEKFRPDMRMLTRTSYALYEVHVNGDERRLLDNEKVLFVQLNWGKDVREGRFLLKQEGVPTISAMDKENTGAGKTFTRKLSKREKKEKKKQDKQKQKDHGGGLADKLYTDMPESKFTRSISNPEAVMKRRRQMKVEKKLQQCRGQDGQGGTLKIYGETLRPDIPYKTLLLSTGDDVEYVIKEALEKYDLDREDPSDFCLFQVLVPTGEREYHGGAIGQERVMEPHECPLGIAMRFPPSEGTVMFQLKRRPADSKKTKHKKIRAVSHEDLRPTKDTIPPHQLPYLVELNPDGSDNPKGKVCRLNMKFTEVGTDRNMLIQLHGPNVQPRHCVIGLTQSDGIVTITPTSPESETIVNNQRIQETTTLRHGMTLRFGKLNVFKFMDPHFEEKMRKGQMPMDFQQKRPGPQHPPHAKVHETNFDVDGKVESLGSSSPRGSDRGPEPMEVQQKRPPPSQTSPRDMVDGRPPPSRQEDALPAVLEFREDKEDGFLRSVILEINSSGTQFKLAPTYTSYMAVRYCISGGYRPDMSPHDRAHRVTGLVNKISHLVHQAVQNNRDNPVALALWMANASEILNFFKQDHDIHPFSLEAQEILAESVQLAFHHLVNCLQYDLQRTMTAFLDENDAADDDEVGDDRHRYAGKPTLGDVLDTLSSAMNLLRRCRVNAALTIQLFSQLFHYVNMWLFNVLVTEKRVQLCTRSWGMRLKRRLGRVEAWAEKQGLELAADCHLCRIIQAAHLLEAPKSSADDIANICSTCFKLNSLQLRELLQQYIPEPNEPPIPQNLIDQVVRVAENMEDEKIKSDGRDVRLEEDPDLQLPFLLPEDGYSCDTIRGIPNGLGEFVEPLSRAGVCRMVAQPGSTGEWTVYMNVDDGANIEQAIRKNQPNQPNQLQHGGSPPDQKPPMSKEPEVAVISFGKVKGSMGLSIVAAKGDNQKERGIYIKSVVTGGGADIDGRLQSGDQLLEVDGKSLVGLTQERAAELMTHTGQTVKLKVAKQGAFYHGLATQLSQPSPVMQRAATKKPSSPQATKHRPADEGPPPYTQDGMDRRHMPPGGHREQPPFDKRLQNAAHSRSSPALNKYRHGVTHKDMESIYGRNQGLWRIVLEAELQDLKSRSPTARQRDLKERRQRSKSITSVEEARRNFHYDNKKASNNGLNENIHDEIRRKAKCLIKRDDVDLRLLQKEVQNLKTTDFKNPPVNNNLIRRHKRSQSFRELSSSKREHNLPNDDFQFNQNYDPNYMKNLFITSRVKNVNHNPQYRSDIRNVVNQQVEHIQDRSKHTNGHPGYDTNTLDSTLSSYQSFKDKCFRTNILSNSDSGFSEPSVSSLSQHTSQRSLAKPMSSHGRRQVQKPDYRRTKSLTSLESSHNSMFGFMNSTMAEEDRMSNSSSNNSEFVYNVKQNVITRNPRSKCITNSTRMYDGVGPGPERRGPPTSMPPSQPDRFQHRDPREIDPKSKSMANLRMEQPYDPRDPHQMMRPAASVGALQNAGQPINDYYNQGDRRNDPRGHDYENHQNLDTRLQKGPIDPTRNERNFPQNTIERQPPSSRTSNSSYREERPQSAYFGQQPERHDSRTDRPHSMEMNANKVHEWQQKYGMDPGQNSPHNHSFEHRDPNYMNTRPPVTAQQAGYVNQGDIPRLNANNESYQPNFYENTVPRQNGNSPAFQQLRGPGIEFDKSKSLPNVNKPHVAPKPISQKMPHVDIPKVEVDNRQTQPHFFDPRLQAADQRSPRTSQPNFSPSMTGIPTSTSYADAHSPMSRPIKKISPGREMYNTHRSPELPPPPQDIPPELPPPPAMDDLTEELPPLPPPPVQEYPGHGDPQYVNQGDARVNLNGPQPYHHPSFNPHQPTHMFQPPGRQDNPQRNVGITQPQRQQPTKGLVSQPPQRFQTNHDYQNITYDNKNQNRSFDSPHHQSPNHITYEQHDHRAQTLPGNMSGLQQNMIQQNQMLIQQGKVRIVQEMQDRTKDGKVGPSSPWDREEQEKQEKMKEEEVIRSRNEEIAFLEAKSYLSPQEQDRLRKLRFEQEFQRRVEEVASREDDDDDSDTEMTRTSHGREFLITSIRDDIHKAQKRMKDLETRQHFEEYEKEKDRMQRLERKLEIFERERQERQERLQKQQERKQREHDEYLRKQKKEQVDNLELREKQRQEYEANKRVHIQEAEKLQQRKEEELQRRKEMEREQLQRMQAQRDAEEAALRAEARRREEEYRREEMERQREKERQEQREIRVNEERKRLENMSNNSHTGYQPYANLPAQSQFEKGAPPPPQRGTSSYEMANQSFGNRSNIQTSVPTNNVNNYRGMSTSRSHPGPEISAPPGMIPKKSVSFNTQPDTHLYTPHGSQSSYRTSSVSSDTNNVSFEQNMPLQSQNDSVFNNSPQQNHVEAKYRTSENTPGVIGSQEIYRDPRNRIAAQKEANSKKGPGAERMSFRDKMKYFAAEAGENTPKEKPKASRTLRNIESQLHNGQ
ncbi:afadin-like isoform X1 [Mytilus californianus]|uniref:afadin-like isoform X1 n=2 Tax=Mytilus californianus TaxID=6549 RepID=UPI002245F2A3|nr:afadin-like isoform X1 [Mytilus californianus]